VFWLVRDGRVQEFDGDLEDYRKLSLERHRQAPDAPAGSTATAAPDAREARRSAAERREQLRPLKQRITALERQMEKHQQALRTLEERLADTAIYDNSRSAELREVLRTQGTMRQELEQTEEAWLAASEELEAAGE